MVVSPLVGIIGWDQEFSLPCLALSLGGSCTCASASRWRIFIKRPVAWAGTGSQSRMSLEVTLGTTSTSRIATS